MGRGCLEMDSSTGCLPSPPLSDNGLIHQSLCLLATRWHCLLSRCCSQGSQNEGVSTNVILGAEQWKNVFPAIFLVEKCFDQMLMK